MRGWAAPLVLLALGACGTCGTCERLAGPEAEIAGALHALGERGSGDALPGFGELRVSQARFDRLLIKPEDEGFVAVGTVDAEASLAGTTSISYLGLERVPFRYVEGRWRLSGPLLPALAQVVELLSLRSRALETGDLAAVRELTAAESGFGESGPRRVRAWTVRIERERAEVLEEYQQPGEPGGPWRDGRKRLLLVREGGRFRFAAGLR